MIREPCDNDGVVAVCVCVCVCVQDAARLSPRTFETKSVGKQHKSKDRSILAQGSEIT